MPLDFQGGVHSWSCRVRVRGCLPLCRRLLASIAHKRVGFLLLAGRLYKPFARKPGLDGLRPGKKRFCLVALDPRDRLRYPPASVFFDMCWWSWMARGVWEHLFDIEFVHAKVGS